ncbi:MAG: hypothetical protein IJ496_02885 [Ruminococcus sp.]|nr:hypothetical protein [Ruminococcus sp.]
MANTIGFTAGDEEIPQTSTAWPAEESPAPPRRSVVQVFFPDSRRKLSYYNDQFDLHCGDLVYVEGKLEGQLGRVAEVNYNFKIRISEYKRVIALVDTAVQGEFCVAGAQLITFDPGSLPYSKVLRWFKAPEKEGEIYASGNDDSAFRLDDLKEMKIAPEIAERGVDYYKNDRVRCICLDGPHGRAIVEGEAFYEVEFEYCSGEISSLVCTCPCCYTCKHEFAAMLQLRETLEYITNLFSREYERTGYFISVEKSVLLGFVLDHMESGRITFG